MIKSSFTCLLPVFFCAGVAPPSAWEREGVATDLLLPVCTAEEALAAGLDAEAPGDAFALPCVATLTIEKHIPNGPQVVSYCLPSCLVSPRMANHPDLPPDSTGHETLIFCIKRYLLAPISQNKADPHLAAAAGRLRHWAGLHAARGDEAILPKAPIA